MEEKNRKCGSSCESRKIIKGIVCGVKGCAYHNGEDHCCAESVCIGPRDAKCSASTACATFKPEESC